MADSVAELYDGLAAEYHPLFADWDASVGHQGEILDRLIVGRPASARWRGWGRRKAAPTSRS